MSVRQERPKQERDGESTLGLLNEVKAGDSPLGEGRAFDVVNSSNPLSRTVVVNIKSSLNDIVMSKDKAEWRPSREAIKNICKIEHARACARTRASTGARLPTRRVLCVQSSSESLRASTAPHSPWAI